MPSRYHQLPEAELIHQAIIGDREAFGELYERHLDAIYRYVFYRIGDSAEAEDLTETVFLKAWEAIGKYRQRGVPFTAWLYRIAHNAIADRHRVRKIEVSLESQHYLPDEGKSPEEQVAWRQRTDFLARAIAQLDPDYQQILILRFINGLSHAETGRIMKRSQGAVRVLQHRALAALREQMSVTITSDD